MDKAIVKRLKKDWRLTKHQLEYVTTFIDPNFCNNCGICIFNLKNYYGLIASIKVIPPEVIHGAK